MHSADLLLQVFAAFAVAAARIAGERGESFQAIAHLYVGFLSGRAAFDDEGRWPSLAIAAALCVVEVACFLWAAG